MTVAAWVFACIAALAASANWWSRWTGHRRTELWSKPATLIALIGVAVSIEPAEPAVRAWFVAALVFSLAGDVFLLDDRRFVAGLGAFLTAHLAYVAGFIAADEWRWWAFILATLALTGMCLTVGARIIRGARQEDRALGGAVIAYLLVISAMAATAAAAGNWWAIIGASLFVTSDALLGWGRFVEAKPMTSFAVMVTYHLGQGALVASLL